MQIFKIHENDNVAVAIETIPAGSCVEINGGKITANMEIPAGHKMALRDIKEGEQNKRTEWRNYISCSRPELQNQRHWHSIA